MFKFIKQLGKDDAAQEGAAKEASDKAGPSDGKGKTNEGKSSTKASSSVSPEKKPDAPKGVFKKFFKF